MQWGIQTDGDLFHYERHDGPMNDAPKAAEAETDMSKVRAPFLSHWMTVQCRCVTLLSRTYRYLLVYVAVHM